MFKSIIFEVKQCFKQNIKLTLFLFTTTITSVIFQFSLILENIEYYEQYIHRETVFKVNYKLFSPQGNETTVQNVDFNWGRMWISNSREYLFPAVHSTAAWNFWWYTSAVGSIQGCKCYTLSDSYLKQRWQMRTL